MRIVSDGKSWPRHRLVRRWRKFWFDCRDALACEVEIRDGDQVYRFGCAGMLELSRCMSLFTKERGTCEWIQDEVQPNEVFYDIGANIGLYTILAGRRVGPHGKVYGFEPHGPNFARLLGNIALNDLQNVVMPCSAALYDQPGFFAFNYVSSEVGSADSQLATTRRSAEKEYRPEIAELKCATTIDALISDGVLEPAHHVKLDVDGNELFILRGMTCLLRSPDRPRSIQVEINKRHKDEIVPFMADHGYDLASRHYTRSGLKRIERGEDPEGYAYNAIFRPLRPAASGLRGACAGGSKSRNERGSHRMRRSERGALSNPLEKGGPRATEMPGDPEPTGGRARRRLSALAGVLRGRPTGAGRS